MSACVPYLSLLAAVYSEEQVRAALRQDALPVTFGILFIAIGVAAVLFFRFAARNRDPIVLWFGVFSLLFGLRLLLLADTVRAAAGVEDPLRFYLSSFITYVIPIPAVLVLRELFPSWRGLLRYVLYFQAAFALAGVAGDLIGRRPESLGPVNNALMLVTFPALIVALFRQSGSTESVRPILIGALTFAFTIVLQNLAGLNILPFRTNLEPLGFAVFLGALGRVVGARIIDREERLAALDQELKVARQIQQSILPREIPQIPGVRIAARYLPMTAVAGDFYDFLQVDGQRLGILIADVSGHGVPAALIASMVKVAIAAELPHADDPAKVLGGMNRTLCGKLQGQFVTAAYLFLDLAAGRIRYAAAGHPALLWCRRAEATAEALVENGLMLGLFAPAQYTFAERSISGSDRFLLYTDGLVEATDGSDEMFGAERVKSVLLAQESGDADRASEVLFQKLNSWTGYGAGRSQEDDLTAIVIDVTMPGDDKRLSQRMSGNSETPPAILPSR